MTIDEAIKICEEDVEKIGGSPQSDRHAERCRQLAEWLMELRARRLLMDKVCTELAELYGSPCNYSPQDEYMLENGSCEDCCGEISDKECWFRYFHRKFNCARMDGDTE